MLLTTLFMRFVPNTIFKGGLLMITALSLSSCSGQKDGPEYEGTQNFRKDAVTFTEMALLKNQLELKLYSYASDGFKKDYFAGEISADEYHDYFKSVSEMALRVEEYEKAIKQLNKSGILSTPTTKGILGSAHDFFSWVTGAGERSRERILTVASNLTEGDRTQLYDRLRPEWKSKSSSEADFWNKLEKGDYDSQASQMFSDFQIDNENFAFTSAEKNLTLHKIVVTEGVKGVETGAGLYVDAIGDVTGLGTGMDVANVMVMTGDLIEADNPVDKAEIAKNISKSLFGLGLDVGDFDQATLFKYGMDAADIVAKNLGQKLADIKNIAAADAKSVINVADTDPGSSCDVVIAVKDLPSVDISEWGAPVFVSVGKTPDGVIPVKLDVGDYKITAIDKEGNKDTQKVTAPKGGEKTVTVETISPKDREETGKPSEGSEGKEDDKVSEEWKGYVSRYGMLSYFIPFGSKIMRVSFSDEGVNNLFDGTVWAENADCKKYMELYGKQKDWTQDSDSSTKYFYKYVTIGEDECKVAVSWRTKAKSVDFVVHSPNSSTRDDW